MQTRFSALVVATIIASSYGTCRYLLITSLIRPGDGLAGISFIYALISSFLSVFLLMFLIYQLIKPIPIKNIIACITMHLSFLFIVIWFSMGTYETLELKRAFADSKNAATKANVLRALSERYTGLGYGVDYNLAANPSSPADLLTKLYNTPDPRGTDVLLASNPNTPTKIIVALALRDDAWNKEILKSVRTNPKYPSMKTNIEDACNKQPKLSLNTEIRETLTPCQRFLATLAK